MVSKNKLPKLWSWHQGKQSCSLEGHRASTDAVREKKMKARGLGHPGGLGSVICSLAGAHKVHDSMQGLDKGTSDGEVRRTIYAHAWCIIGCGRPCQQQRAPKIPRGSSRGSPSLGVEVLIEGVIKALCTQQWWEHPATVTDQHMQEEASEWRSTC